MPKNTPNLNLYKVNGETDGNDTFNVDVVLNDNWDKIDAAIKEVEDAVEDISIPDASLTKKGITQLSSAIDGDREDRAATEKAVHDATKYADTQINFAKAQLQQESKEDKRGMERELANLNLQLEASKRVPSGVTFGSNFTDSFGMTIDTTKTATTAALSVGAKSISAESVNGLAAGMEVTIFDDVNIERVTITSISGTTLTVPALSKEYKTKASVARTSAVIDTVSKCAKFGGWTRIITSTLLDGRIRGYETGVTTSIYSSSGRKLARCRNGTLVSVVLFPNAFEIWTSVDNGLSWGLYLSSSIDSVQDVSVVSTGESRIHLIVNADKYTSWRSYDITKPYGVDYYTTTLSSVQTVPKDCCVVINDSETEIHAAWNYSGSPYPNSYNIRYAKGIINSNGSVSWGAVEQVTNLSSTDQFVNNVSLIVYKDGYPAIIHSVYLSGSFNIRINKKTSSGWNTGVNGIGTAISIGTGSYNQIWASAIFIPQSINGLLNGRIWVTWAGNDSSENTNHIRTSYSDDGGVTWSQPNKLTSGARSYAVPSISVNKNGKVFLVYYAVSGGIFKLEYVTAWSTPVQIIDRSTLFPSTLYDPKLDFDEPLFIFQESNVKIGFNGVWKIQSEAPILENDIRFTVKDTDEAVTWVQHDAGLTVSAALNGQAMDKTTAGNEDQFVKALAASGPAEIRLTMKRSSTSDDVKITKILGGVD